MLFVFIVFFPWFSFKTDEAPIAASGPRLERAMSLQSFMRHWRANPLKNFPGAWPELGKGECEPSMPEIISDLR